MKKILVILLVFAVLFTTSVSAADCYSIVDGNRVYDDGTVVPNNPVVYNSIVCNSIPEDPVEDDYPTIQYIVSIVDPENPPQDIEAGIWEILEKKGIPRF